MSAMNPSENKSKLTKAQILSAPELRIGSEIDNPDMTIQTIINRPVVNTNKMSRLIQVMLIHFMQEMWVFWDY